MLGISGFESSANYVEEQKEGVFPKTLRNMWVVFFMLYRTYIFKGFLDILGYVFPDKGHLFKTLNLYTKKLLAVINRQQFVFFTNHDDVASLNKVMLYIEKNEPTRILKIVAVVDEKHEVVPNLKKDIEVLNRAYPDIHIQFIEEEGVFGPEKIKELSKRWKIPVNFMFIGSPGDKFPYKIQELGDVRHII